MNIKFYNNINNCNSAIEASIALEKVQKDISSILNSKLKDYIKSSPLSLIITLVAFPTESQTANAHKHSDKLWSCLSDELASDAHLYAFRNRLGTIDIPYCVSPLLIAIGLTEFSTESVTTDESNHEEDCDERPSFKIKKPKWQLDDVLLSDEVRFRIIRALSIIENRDLIFDTWGFKGIDKSTKSIICFYGAPGTGKTMTAEAIASYLHKPIVHSSYAEIESKWVGEGAKNLHAIFDFAEQNDAVLFFDEADSFLSSRITATEGSSDKHYNRMSNELFQLLEDFNGCVVFSTNLLTDVDEAFKSRIIDSIKFELPDRTTRISLIKKLLPPQFPLSDPLNDDQYKILSELSDGFSGRDLRKSMLLALAGAAIKAKKENKTSFSFVDIRAGIEEVRDYKIKMEAEQGFIPTDEVENVIESQKKNENLVDIAIYAMYSDGVLHESEKSLIKDYSRALLGCSIEDPVEQPTKSIQDICLEAKSNHYATELLDTAIRVVAADGDFASTEETFIKRIVELLGFNNSTELILNYCRNLTSLNREWIGLNLNLAH